MATVYKIELVSYWVNYSKRDLEKLLNDAIKKDSKFKKNEIKLEVINDSEN